MKYKERDALVASLREFIEFLEEKGHELPLRLDITLNGRVSHYHPKTLTERDPRERKRELKKAVRLLKPVRKEYSGSSLSVIRKFGNLSFTVPGRTEEEVEWVCTDPLLKETA